MALAIFRPDLRWASIELPNETLTIRRIERSSWRGQLSYWLHDRGFRPAGEWETDGEKFVLEIAPLAERDNVPELTPTQRRVVAQAALGKTSKEIAVSLGLAYGTVQSHRRQITSRLGTPKIADWARYAMARGLITEDN